MDRWIKKWYMYTMVHCSVIKKNGIMPSAAPRVGLRIITLESRGARATTKEEKDTHITHVWSLKHDTSELIYKTEPDSQRTGLWLPRGRRAEEGWSGSLGLAGRSYWEAQGTGNRILR